MKKVRFDKKKENGNLNMLHVSSNSIANLGFWWFNNVARYYALRIYLRLNYLDFTFIIVYDIIIFIIHTELPNRWSRDMILASVARCPVRTHVLQPVLIRNTYILFRDLNNRHIIEASSYYCISLGIVLLVNRFVHNAPTLFF